VNTRTTLTSHLTKQPALKDWRNDAGGHFDDRAAEFAIDNIEPETIGALELFLRDDAAVVAQRGISRH